jgi:hypothetical protein
VQYQLRMTPRWGLRKVMGPSSSTSQLTGARTVLSKEPSAQAKAVCEVLAEKQAGKRGEEDAAAQP